MPKVTYDAEGNPLVESSSEDAAAPVETKAKPAAKKRKLKRKRAVGDIPSEDAAPEAGDAADGTAQPTSSTAADVVTADTAFSSFELAPELKADATEVPLEELRSIERRPRSDKGNPTVGPKPKAAAKPFWERKRGKWRNGQAMKVLSNKPEVEVPNAEHVRDVYSVKRGKG